VSRAVANQAYAIRVPVHIQEGMGQAERALAESRTRARNGAIANDTDTDSDTDTVGVREQIAHPSPRISSATLTLLLTFRGSIFRTDAR